MALLLGLLVGSFLNVVIHRLPIMLEREWREECAELQPQDVAPAAAEPYNLVVPRSACPRCHAPIAAWHNIPVLSWLLLRGRCASCRARISVRYPLIELLCGVLSAAVVWKFGLRRAGMRGAAGDLVPDRTRSDRYRSPVPAGRAHAAAAVGRPARLARLEPDHSDQPAGQPRDAILGAAGGYLSLWCVYQLFKLVHRQGRHGVR